MFVKKRKKIFILSTIIGVILILITLILFMYLFISSFDLYFPLTTVVPCLALFVSFLLVCYFISCVYGYYKENSRINYVKLIVLLVFNVLLYIISIPVNQLIQLNYIGCNEEKIEEIQTNVTSDYQYFDIKPSDFDKVIRYEFHKQNIKTKKMTETTSDLENYKYQYQIKIYNGDILYIYSNYKDKIELIRYYQTNQKNNYSDVCMGILSRLFINNINTDDFLKKMSDEFLNKENVNSLSDSENADGISYVYGHIKYYIHNDDSCLDLDFSVVPETTNEEYEKNIQSLE